MYVIACLFLLRNATGFMRVLIGLCLVGFCYGGYLAMMPSFTADSRGRLWRRRSVRTVYYV